MTEYEYERFVLLDYEIPACRYKKINDDLKKPHNEDIKPMLKKLRKKMTDEYETDALQYIHEHNERKIIVKKLARRAASEMLASSKVSDDTMFEIIHLENKDIEETFRLANKLATSVKNITERIGNED